MNEQIIEQTENTAIMLNKAIQKQLKEDCSTARTPNINPLNRK